MKVIVIIGLPGSGKTTYAKTLGGFLVDDPMPGSTFIDDALGSDEPLVVITDPLATSANRTMIEARVGKRELTLVCFENDPEACWANIERRGDNRMSREWLDRFSRAYRVDQFTPDLILPVYRAPDMNVDIVIHGQTHKFYKDAAGLYHVDVGDRSDIHGPMPTEAMINYLLHITHSLSYALGKHEVQVGDLDGGVPNNHDHTRRGFNPK